MPPPSPPLSEHGPRRDPPSRQRSSRVLQSPLVPSLPPGAQAGNTSFRCGIPPGPPPGIPGGAGQPRARPRKTAISRATSCHRPSSPHHCASCGPEAPNKVAQSEAAPRPFVCQIPPFPGRGRRESRSPVPAREVATSWHRRAPARTLRAALTVAPWLLLQAGGGQGRWPPGRPGARGSAKRAYDPQVAGHPEQGSERAGSKNRVRRYTQQPAAGPGWRWQRGHNRGGTARARRPIGPRREEAGPRPGPIRPFLRPCQSLQVGVLSPRGLGAAASPAPRNQEVARLLDRRGVDCSRMHH